MTGTFVVLEAARSFEDFFNTFPFFFLETLVAAKESMVQKIFIFLLPLSLTRPKLEVEATGVEIGFLNYDLLGLDNEEPGARFAGFS